ncbi:amidase signature domain-containing protein [Helicostylum pulchrum]|uniref:Amidase domain-containing protein n=1 Tax=Helicostylum pulchrum TaxID=562976 RepID=A0ABP9YCJ8_9FUNG|nr:amidase signature domain-containing protein [Helicostylum pulchrum]
MSDKKSINTVNEKPDFEAPELYGLTLLLAASAINYVPFAKYKVANDALLYTLRDRNDITDHPNTTAIPPTYMNTTKDVSINQPSIQLNPEHKSVSPFLSFWDYHEAYTQFKTTPTEVANSLLIKLDQSKLMNWVRFNCQDIQKQAEASTERYKLNKPLSQMDGVFVAIKEELDIQGLETKVGTCFINDGTPAKEDATLVLKLRKSGAIIIGSTVMNELGWDTFTVNPNTGMPKNPYGTVRTCGGSSGGSGGVVAGGLVPVAIGADGGGSIRIPSAFSGLYGLKTTYARVSGHGGATVDPTLGSYGPMAATADDMALTYSIIGGPDPKDANSLLQPLLHLKDYDNYLDLSDLTIAITPEWNQSTVEPAILEQLDIFKNYLQKLGARFVEIEIPDLDISAIAHNITICSEMYTFASSHPKKFNSFLAHTRLLSGVASALETRDYVRAQQVRTRMMNNLRGIFEDQKIDLILCPTSAILAPEIPEKAHKYGMCNTALTVQSMAYCTLANLTGIPAVTVPAGFHHGIPVALQFMTSWWNEALLCRIAKACERAPGVERKRPEHWFAVDELI